MARLTPLPLWRQDEDPVPEAGMLPVLPALRGLLPGGLRRGTVVAVGGWGLLCLAVAARRIGGRGLVRRRRAAAARGGGGGRGRPGSRPTAPGPGSGRALAAGGGLAA